MKCLIAERKRAPRSLLTKILKSMGHGVDSALDEEELLDELKKDHDILFISPNISKENSIELIQDIRRLKGEIPYIFLTVLEDKKERLIPALENGVDDFMVKPFDRDQVKTRVKRAERIIKGRETFEEIDFDPVFELGEEHKLLERIANVFQVIVSKTKEKGNERTLNWIADSSFLLDTKIHHEKENFLMMNFLENAIKVHGEVSKSKLFNRASLKSVDEEHDELEQLVEDIQVSVGNYLDGSGEIELVKDNIDSYSALVYPHIDREERFLFPLIKKYLYQEDLSELKGRFDTINEEKSEGLDKLHKQIKTAEDVLGIKSE